LERGARLGRPRFDPTKNLATWSDWHRFVSESRATFLTTASGRGGTNQNASVAPTKAALIVIIDNGTCTLSLLIENLSTHMRRFAGRAAFLILSARRGELQEALFEMFNDGSETPASPLCILDSRAIDEAQQLILASAFVFFVDAE